jgi:transposase
MTVIRVDEFRSSARCYHCGLEHCWGRDKGGKTNERVAICPSSGRHSNRDIAASRAIGLRFVTRATNHHLGNFHGGTNTAGTD